MHIFLFVKNSASSNFFIAHSYFLLFWLFCFGLRFKKKMKKKAARIRTQLRDRSRILWVFIASKMNFSLRPGKKKNFPRREPAHIVVFSLAQREATTFRSQSVFHTWFTPNSYSHEHKYPHPLQTALTCTPLNDHAEHSSETLSTFDFISFSFCVSILLSIKIVLFAFCCCCTKRLRDTIWPPTYLWYIFWG